MIKHKPITRDLYEAFYGEPPVLTVKGVAFLDGDEIVGMAFTARRGAQWLAVDIRRHDIAMKRALIRAWRECHPPRPVYVIEDSLLTARSFIQHFGFKPVRDKIWVY